MMQISRFLYVGLLLASSVILRLDARLFGYDRLYNPYNNMTIDILYDRHNGNEVLNRKQMYNMAVSEVEKSLYPSEQKFLQVLRSINQRNQGVPCVDLIWEYGYTDYSNNSFYESEWYFGRPGKFSFFFERLIKDQFKNINVIASDIVRGGLHILLSSKDINGLSGPDKTLGWCSFDNPLNLSEKHISTILKNSGNQACHEFMLLYDSIIGRLHDRFSFSFTNGSTVGKNLRTQLEMSSITDLEMITHILSSDKFHVIVYVGANHARRISRFLQDRVGCHLLHSFSSEDTVDVCVPFELLEKIEQPYTPGFEGSGNSHNSINEPFKQWYERTYVQYAFQMMRFFRFLK